VQDSTWSMTRLEERRWTIPSHRFTDTPGMSSAASAKDLTRNHFQNYVISANARIERLEAAIHSSGRITGYPDIGLQKRFCPSSLPSVRNHSLPALHSKEPRGEESDYQEHCFSAPCETVPFCGTKPPLQLIEVRRFGVRATQ
jgi:hypothetical protein